MQITYSPAVAPLRLSVSVVFEAADLNAAFTNQTDPDEELFYAAFSEEWENNSTSKKLEILSRIARLAEDAQAKALNMTAGNTEPK
jgi:hypothetical protein